MGEMLQPVIPGFNRSLRVESRADRLTGDPGAVLTATVIEAIEQRLKHLGSPTLTPAEVGWHVCTSGFAAAFVGSQFSLRRSPHTTPRSHATSACSIMCSM